MEIIQRGDNDRVDKWKNRRDRSEAATFYGVLESFEFCFTDNAFANLESFARALPRGSFSKLRVLSDSYVELGNLRYRQQSVQSV